MEFLPPRNFGSLVPRMVALDDLAIFSTLFADGRAILSLNISSLLFNMCMYFMYFMCLCVVSIIFWLLGHDFQMQGEEELSEEEVQDFQKLDKVRALSLQ